MRNQNNSPPIVLLYREDSLFVLCKTPPIFLCKSFPIFQRTSDNGGGSFGESTTLIATCSLKNYFLSFSVATEVASACFFTSRGACCSQKRKVRPPAKSCA